MWVSAANSLFQFRIASLKQCLRCACSLCHSKFCWCVSFLQNTWETVSMKMSLVCMRVCGLGGGGAYR